MSEGVEQGPVTDASFWAERWHWIADAIVDAIVASGLCPEIDPEHYDEVKQKLQRGGLTLPMAAAYAFSVCKQKMPSACEVNPW